MPENDTFQRVIQAVGRAATIVVSIGLAALGLAFFGVFALVLAVVVAVTLVYLWFQGRRYRKLMRERDDIRRRRFRDYASFMRGAKPDAPPSPRTIDVTAEVEYVDDPKDPPADCRCDDPDTPRDEPGAK